ncbi:MAG: class I SAM-dependent methyltransferase [Anaerolineales bacterium]|nr:class I SAM-dependent methyltransferase [Anaerolineales bacterium]
MLELPIHAEIDRIIGHHIGVKPIDAQRLAWLAYLVPAGGQIVECGSFWGRSAAYILSGAKPSVRLVCIDHWPNPADFKKFERGLTSLGWPLGGKVQAIKSVSWEVNLQEEIDMLFLDSTHKYAVLEREWAAFFPLVKPGGIVAFHDYGAHTWPDVQRFVDEVAADHLEHTGTFGTVWSGVKK